MENSPERRRGPKKWKKIAAASLITLGGIGTFAGLKINRNQLIDWEGKSRPTPPSASIVEPKPSIREVLKLRPGSCLVLEEKYCNKGTFITNQEGKVDGVGFDIPGNVPVFAPFDGFMDKGKTTFVERNETYPEIIINERTNSNTAKLFSMFFSNKDDEEERIDVKKGDLMVKTTPEKLQFFQDYNLIVYFGIANQKTNILVPDEEEVLRLFKEK